MDNTVIYNINYVIRAEKNCIICYWVKTFSILFSRYLLISVK